MFGLRSKTLRTSSRLPSRHCSSNEQQNLRSEFEDRRCESGIHPTTARPRIGAMWGSGREKPVFSTNYARTISWELGHGHWRPPKSIFRIAAGRSGCLFSNTGMVPSSV